ncbi:MAG: sel1 repeat family protein [Alphaproteobacteria bacterium]|nr:sel1 repeat family protein [Alphaproteobacteria bacterium]
MARMEMGMELAALTGAPDALFELGIFYATGLEIEPNLVVAHKWFNLAAARGNSSARHYRSEIAQEMAPEEIATAQKLAREWLQTH